MTMDPTEHEVRPAGMMPDRGRGRWRSRVAIASAIAALALLALLVLWPKLDPKTQVSSTGPTVTEPGAPPAPAQPRQ